MKVIPLCRDAVGVFYSPNWLVWIIFVGFLKRTNQSRNEVNFTKGSSTAKQYLDLFPGNWSGWILSYPKTLSAWSSLMITALRIFYLPESQCFHSIDCFFLTQIFCSKPIFRSFIHNFLTKTFFSVHITHSSVHFTWFALLSHPEFDDKPLFKPGACGLIYNHFE